jgi:aspartate beta-hydroxylase
MTIPPPNPSIPELIQRCERAFNAGQREEAARLLATARSLAPQHPMVLNALGVQDLQQGQFTSALAYLEQAVAQEPGNVALWINLASVLRKLGQRDAELTALERALDLEPRHLLAMLQKASLFELQGDRRRAATTYHNALQSIPPNTPLPPSLRVPLQHATAMVEANNNALAAFVHDAVAQSGTSCTAQERARFDQCIDLVTGRRRHYLPQPTFMYFPHLPAFEFYDRADFPWLAELEAHTAEIRGEFEAVFASDAAQLEPYVNHPAGVPLDQWVELNHSRRWSVYFLWKEGQPLAEHQARCPVTTALLSKIPRIEIPGYAPTAFFSVLNANAHIPAHTGVTNTRLIVHLPLIVPEGCRFRVGAEMRTWQPHEALVFDDSIEHEAWNDSPQPRTVLIFDVWNPYLTPKERELISTATAAIKRYHKGTHPLSEAP